MIRRTFIRNSFVLTALAGHLPSAVFAREMSQSSITIQQVIDRVIAQIPGGRMDVTVDTVKSGDTSQVCTGIVSTFLANTDVIKEAIKIKANLIITHEPTFYNHLDEKEWLGDDPVLKGKEKLLTDNNIVVWRFHDYWHKTQPDGVLKGVVDQLDWGNYWVNDDDNLFEIPPTSLKDLCKDLGERFGSERATFIGDPEMKATNVAILPGAAGRYSQIDLLQRSDVEVLVVGEVAEWETAEYVRDAAGLGMQKGLIVIGHQPSEEPGMVYAVQWLQKLLPEVPIMHVSSKDGFITTKG